MKVAVIKLGARISFGSNTTSGGTGEAISLINMLVKGGIEVTAFTKIIKKDEMPSHINVLQISEYYETVNNYDALIVINGTVNFMGGQEDKEQILNYWMINHFKGTPIYLYCDPNLPLKQIWASIEKKEWASNWNKDDIFITKPIHVISQSYNLTLAKNQFKEVEVSQITQYPFHQFPMMFKPPRNIMGKTVDISYGGTFRSGRREKKLIDFYFGLDGLDVEIFGKIKLSDFNEKKVGDLTPPRFTGAVNYDQMINKMSEAKFHIVIGDGKYSDFEMINQRTYESIMAKVITFVDIDLDRNKRIYGDNPIGDLLYVKDRKDVLEKISTITDEIYDEIIQEQFNAVNFNEGKYCSEFVSMIKELV